MKLAIVLFVLATGCATANTVSEIQPLTASLAPYATVSIVVIPAPTVRNADAAKAQLSMSLEKAIRDRKLFEPASNGDLLLEVHVDALDEPSDGQEALCSSGSVLCTSSDAKVAGTAKLVDAKTKATLGTIAASGTSSHAPLGSVKKSKGAMAHDDFAMAIADYIDQHRR